MVIEQLILSRLLDCTSFANDVFVHLKEDWFEDAGRREIFKMIQAFHQKYSSLPTVDSLSIDIQNIPLSERAFKSAVDALEGIASDKSEVDIRWLRDETEKWAKNRALYLAMSESLILMEADTKGDKRDKIPMVIQEALSISFDNDYGHDWLLDAEEQYRYYTDPVNKVPYRIDILNRATRGGNTRKSLSVVQAGIGVGKTTFLLNIAADYARDGLNVIYYSGEIAENGIRERIDVNLFEEPSERLRSLDFHQYMNRVKAAASAGLGKLIVKEFPAGGWGANNFRKHIKDVEQEFNIKIDAVCYDYIELVKADRLSQAARSDSDLYFTIVAEELRNLSKEFDLIGWTAQQFNREGQDTLNPKMSNSGRSIGVQKTSDFTIAIVATDDYKANNQALATILKNRFANKVTLNKFVIGLNDDIQRFYDAPEDQIDSSLKTSLEVHGSSQFKIPDDKSEFKTKQTTHGVSGLNGTKVSTPANQGINFGANHGT